MATTDPANLTSNTRYLVHLICGSTGAGKTTYAIELCKKVGGVHLSIDEWMSNLFWQDSPQPLVSGWALTRVDRCFVQIWSMTKRLVDLGVPAVLDLGLSTADDRARFVRPAKEQGYSVQLHVLDAPVEERWRRVAKRNKEKGDTFGIEVTREMFDFVESIWEPPAEAEMVTSNGKRVSVSANVCPRDDG